MAERCVCCGTIIPEGRQVCPSCEEDHLLRPCPFCGGRIFVSFRRATFDFEKVFCSCTECGMEFSYQQNFALSRKARVPMNESFLDVWNRRITDG